MRSWLILRTHLFLPALAGPRLALASQSHCRCSIGAPGRSTPRMKQRTWRNDASDFFKVTPRRLDEIANETGARLLDEAAGDVVIDMAGPVEAAPKGAVSFIDNPKYLRHAATTGASAIFCQRRYADRLPATVHVLVHDQPYKAYAAALAMIFPTAARPQPVTGETGVSEHAFVGRDVSMEEGVIVEAGAVIGDGAAIGRGSHVLAECRHRRRTCRSAATPRSASTPRSRSLRRRPCDHPSWRQYRPGRLRLRHGAGRSPQDRPDRPRHHPGSMSRSAPIQRSIAAPIATPSSARAPRSTIWSRSAITSSSAATASSSVWSALRAARRWAISSWSAARPASWATSRSATARRSAAVRGRSRRTSQPGDKVMRLPGHAGSRLGQGEHDRSRRLVAKSKKRRGRASMTEATTLDQHHDRRGFSSCCRTVIRSC